MRDVGTGNEPHAKGSWTDSALVGLLLIVVGAGVYANTLSGPFIFDDRDSIEENEQIRQLWPPLWLTAMPSQVSASGRPVVSLSLAINYALGELDVRGYHAVNIAVHVICAMVLFGIIRRTLRGPFLGVRWGRPSNGIASACALLWMLHPMQTECVNYIIARTESLMGLFYLLTLYCAIRAMDGRHRLAWSMASVLACAAGMASKEAMVTAPCVVLLYDYAFRPKPFIQVVRGRWGLYAGLASTWVVLPALMVSGPRSDTVGFSLGVSPVQYAMNQCTMIVKYIGLAFWPHPLVLDYGPPTVLSIGDVTLCGTVLAALLLATLVTFIYRPTVGFLGVWFFVILGPTSSFVPIVTEVGAERRMYLPLAGLVTFVVIAVHWLLEQLTARPFALRYAALRPLVRGVPVVAGAATLGWISVVRAADYRSAESVWRAVVEAHPQNARGHYNLGNELRSAGKLDEAVKEYADAVGIKPDYAQAHYNLGKTLRQLGMRDAAISHYREAVRFGRGFANAHFELGIVLNEQGKVDEAIYHYREALRIRPDHADAHVNLGGILRFQGNPQEAVGHFRAALRVRPDHAFALLNLGNVLVAMGQPNEGLANLREAARVKADWPAPFNRLAWILATHPDASVRDPAQAVQYARRASELSQRRDPVILDTLAAAYAAAGDFDQAISNAEASLALLSGTRSQKRAEAIRGRLQLYKLGQPYRELPPGGK